MLYSEIMAVCSQIHTKHINTVCGQNVELLYVKLAVHIVTTGSKEVSSNHFTIPLPTQPPNTLSAVRQSNYVLCCTDRSQLPTCTSHC